MAKGDAVGIHARKLGCPRPKPFSGLCVVCPYEGDCDIPRIPLLLWSTRISLEKGISVPVSLLNDVALSPIGEEALHVQEVDLVTYRTTTVPMRCGDLATGELLANGELNPTKTVNIPTYVSQGVKEGCPKHVLMERRQIHYLHYSNFGRKLTISIQTCSEECAEQLADLMNHHWDVVVRLVRETRPLKRY